MQHAQKEADHGDGGGGADPAFAHAMAEFDVAGQAEDVRASDGDFPEFCDGVDPGAKDQPGVLTPAVGELEKGI